MFPFSDWIDIKGLKIAPEDALEKLIPLLTEDRLKKIDRVVGERTFSVALVLENIYDRGNASAVMRSAEALGITSVHMIELGEKFKESQRTTAGADKWIELKKYRSTADCVKQLKQNGMQIVVTHLDATSKPIAEIDFTRPTALVLGNEKDGVSPEMIAAADHRVLLPMVGFVQSYNISVAGALCFYQIYVDRLRRQGFHGDLNERQKQVLKAYYCLRTQPSAEDMLFEMVQRRELKLQS
jgi:tRNA (guanosine-2'-O-)-methyltransferase